MMSLTNIIILFVAHYIGDFLLQSRWMATNKSKNPWHMGLHGLIVGTVLFTAMSLTFEAPERLILLAVLIYTALHCLQDWLIWNVFNKTIAVTYTRRDALFDKWFFRFLGFDQMIHMIVLFIIASTLII